jgi:hypothetical protein
VLIAGPTLVIVLLAVFVSVKSKEPPMDHDVILRLRSIADQMRREEMLPYD